jgi:hypothetical protein
MNFIVLVSEQNSLGIAVSYQQLEGSGFNSEEESWKWVEMKHGKNCEQISSQVFYKFDLAGRHTNTWNRANSTARLFYY